VRQESVQSLAELHSRVEDPILGTTKGTNFVLIKQLVLGQIELLNQPFILENANNDRWPLKADIILGIDLLRRYNAIIDLLGGSLFLRIHPPDVRTSLAVDEVLRRSGWSVISLAAGNSLCLFTEAKVAGEQFRLLVDSGAAFSELDLPLANRLGLKLHRLLMPITGVGGRAAEQYSSQVPVLELGELSLTNAPVGVANLKLWQAKDGQRFDGLIGADWLGLGQGVLDCHSQRLYLKTLYQGKK
jgi:Aspartyl protease